MLDVGNQALRLLTSFLAELDEHPVVPAPARPGTGAITDEGTAPAEVLAETFTAASAAVETAGPRHFGFIPGGGLFTSAVAELVARGLNRYVPGRVMAPAFAAIEQEVVDWFVKITGLPDTASGVLTTGGSLATLSAVVAARHDKLGDDLTRATFYLTENTNHCVAKAARIAGLPPSSARLVPTTGRLSMDAAGLRATVERDRARGERPFLVVATAGTTSSGTVDELAAIADVAREHGLWLHIDAAYGGLFCLTQHGSALFDGLDRADSIVLDPHKGLFLPYGTGVVLARDCRTLVRGHTPADELPPYLRDFAQSDQVRTNLVDMGPERTREFRGLRVWFPLRVHGVHAFRTALEEKLELARLVHEELAREPLLECPWPPELSIVVFRLRAGDAATKDLRERINASGQAFCSGTFLHGHYYIRICVLSFRTHLAHVRRLLDVIHAAVAG
ncbi:pyridoxal phosphate-dependent decarboxylase family protein [Amycolatopsis sp. NPDC059021]|uniref:pyridoxal phosphate-dependent decarboxylase family protein n=1 Tax=Amycolatopsis sp. NPDC059021 TaxID=3346704 RepID=UPI00366B6EB9